MESSVNNLFLLKPTKDHEVNSTIKRNKTNKTFSPNSIIIKILKFSQQIIEIPAEYLINISFSAGAFPEL